jgi:hypothetical protein
MLLVRCSRIVNFADFMIVLCGGSFTHTAFNAMSTVVTQPTPPFIGTDVPIRQRQVNLECVRHLKQANQRLLWIHHESPSTTQKTSGNVH